MPRRKHWCRTRCVFLLFWVYFLIQKSKCGFFRTISDLGNDQYDTANQLKRYFKHWRIQLKSQKIFPPVFSTSVAFCFLHHVCWQTGRLPAAKHFRCQNKVQLMDATTATTRIQAPWCAEVKQTQTQPQTAKPWSARLAQKSENRQNTWRITLFSFFVLEPTTKWVAGFPLGDWVLP